jgi:superfamily II DNA or RNA helicase
MRWRFVMEAPYFPDGHRNCDATAPVDMWPHQIRVVHEAASAWPAGRLLCDEVGMGKTIEAVIIVRRLLAGRGVRRVLFLVPAGLLRQWQGELREKGGLVVPRLEGSRTLVWPDDESETVPDLSKALGQPLLLVSREYARTEQNMPAFLSAEPWDLVLLDEAHAARRARQEEREFNSATRLLALLRHLQLLGRAKGLLLLSATPMQTHAWEPWDLLSVLGEGAPWIRGDFSVVGRYYRQIASLPNIPIPVDEARWVASVIEDDGAFGTPPVPSGPLHMRLAGGTSAQRSTLGHWLRASAPLGRRMHRNTRMTLRRYFSEGLISRPPPHRAVQDALFVYADPRERDAYDAVTDYVDRRFRELESERFGKGFVMTVYRRRATSSPFALKKSLGRRDSGLHRVVAERATEQLLDLDPEDARDFDEFLLDDAHGPLSSALPDDPTTAAEELRDVQRLLARLNELGDVDSKFDKFLEVLRLVSDDGRAVLVFSEYTDTVRYLRDKLHPRYGAGLACYTGDGGEKHDGDTWIRVSKEEITRRLNGGELRVLLCSDAASEGLNLQAAGALINYDLPWNPSRVEQRIGRIDRIGQLAEVVRVANLVLRDSVDERVYEVLTRRCELFRHFVGAMQPVLAEARGMLLGIRPFSEEVLADVERRVRDEAASLAAFDEPQRVAEAPSAPGVTREDVARALPGIAEDGTALVAGKRRKVTTTMDTLAADPAAWPPYGPTPEVRNLADSLLEAGELLPLVIGVHEAGPFRATVAVWIDKDGNERVDRAERLEALVGMWDGSYAHPKRWIDAEAQAEGEARGRVEAMVARAQAEERAGLQRQIDAARLRVTREVGRFLLCLVPDVIDLNAAFHEQQSRNIASAERLRAAYSLIGYPEWSPEVVRELREEVASLSANQQKTVLIGSPLDAALADPRWQAVQTLSGMTSNRVL